MKKVVVVGGGFSGLVTAYYLSRQGFSVDLHEASPKLGGLLQTERTSSGLVENAANGFIFNEDLAELLADLKLEYIRPLKGAKKRFIFRKRLKRWPLTIFESLKLFFKVIPRMIFRRASLKPQAQETMWAWGLRNFTRGLTKYLLAPVLQGIYAGNVEQMSAELIIGPYFKRKNPKTKRGYRGTISFQNGMGEFIAALERKLRQEGVRIYLNSVYEPEDLTIPHVICVSAAVAPRVVRKVSAELASSLSRIEVLPVLSATLFFKEPQAKIVGFGALFPEDQNFRVLGVLSNAYIFENRGPAYSETWIFGGAHSPEMVAKSPDEILARIQMERKRILGVEDRYFDYRMNPSPQALPHYTLEHKKILEELKLPKNLYLNGNYMGGIGLSKILSRSKELVHEIT
ncbi:MAG TPA: FAD-dependent oxidoreductase [Pseudobdellovibrionaceae bacterium]|jgi:oxygen-dependent protoporphyrinogen oxidase